VDQSTLHIASSLKEWAQLYTVAIQVHNHEQVFLLKDFGGLALALWLSHRNQPQHLDDFASELQHFLSH